LLNLKRIRIFWKLSAVFIVIILLVLVVLVHVNNLLEENYALSTARDISYSYSETILGNVPGMMMTHNLNSMREMMRTLLESNPVCRDMRLVTHIEGSIVAPLHIDSGATLSQDYRSCRLCHDLEDPKERLAVKSQDQIFELPSGERIVSVTIPILNEESCRNAACHVHTDESPVLGILETDFSLQGTDDLISQMNLRTLIIIVIAIVFSCVATWFVVMIFIKRRIRGLVYGMRKLTEKEYDFRLNEDEKDEFGTLDSSFNDMASMLSSSLTELKQTRDYLGRILKRSADIIGFFESTVDIIITVDPLGRIQTINAGAEKALGYRRHDVVNKPMEMFFAYPHERDDAIKRLEHTDHLANFETQFVAKSGEIRDVLLTISRLRNAEGTVIGTIGISKDITKEKRLQHQLIQAQRFVAIGQVFTGIQHSMKNMLNACKGGAYMVRTGLAKDNRKMLEEGWEIVQEGISRLTDMSTDMLKYVKEWKPRIEKVDLTQTLSDIYNVIKQTAKDKGVMFRLEVPPEMPQVSCDARMIHSAVMDIASNALDACLWKDYSDQEVPEVVVSTYPDPDRNELVIEVRDNGCGMTDEVKENIFTPFFSTKSKAGTGLGLSITSRIIDVHDGRIDVESEPNRGTVFRIVLPIDTNNNSREKTNGEESIGS
jgi:PAS domain S-box-containing protein